MARMSRGRAGFVGARRREVVWVGGSSLHIVGRKGRAARGRRVLRVLLLLSCGSEDGLGGRGGG